MSTNVSGSLQADPTDDRTDSELAHDAQFIGTDGDGADHYWSPYQQTAYVVDGDDVEEWPLDETPLSTLSEWVKHVSNKRGRWQECRVTSQGLVEWAAGQLGGE